MYPKQCAVCNGPATIQRRGCAHAEVTYCSVEHQKAHWDATHKAFCNLGRVPLREYDFVHPPTTLSRCFNKYFSTLYSGKSDDWIHRLLLDACRVRIIHDSVTDLPRQQVYASLMHDPCIVSSKFLSPSYIVTFIHTISLLNPCSLPEGWDLNLSTLSLINTMKIHHKAEGCGRPGQPYQFAMDWRQWIGETNKEYCVFVVNLAQGFGSRTCTCPRGGVVENGDRLEMERMAESVAEMVSKEFEGKGPTWQTLAERLDAVQHDYVTIRD